MSEPDVAGRDITPGGEDSPPVFGYLHERIVALEKQRLNADRKIAELTEAYSDVMKSVIALVEIVRQAAETKEQPDILLPNRESVRAFKKGGGLPR
jgi:hypothetical protein